MSGSACTHAARDKHGVLVHQCVLLLICQWGLTFFKAEHVNWSVVSRCRSRSKKVLNDKCARVFVSFGMRGQSLFFNSRGWHHSWSGSLYIAAWWCKNSPQPLSCLTAAIKVYCHFFFPPPNIYGFTRPHYDYTVQPLSFICLFHFTSLTLRCVFESGGSQEEPAVGNCRFYDALEGFPPGDRLQRKQAFLKGKVETVSSAMHVVFLPYKAPKYANIWLYVHSVHWNLAGLAKLLCQDEGQLRRLSKCVLGYMPSTHVIGLIHRFQWREPV